MTINVIPMQGIELAKKVKEEPCIPCMKNKK